MYAVIKTGGKQYRVSEGQRLDVERLAASDETVEFSPILVVDGDRVLATPADLDGSTVSARVVGEAAGPEDHRLPLQEQVEPAQALGPPPALRHDRDHRDLGREGIADHVEDQGRRFHPQRP